MKKTWKIGLSAALAAAVAAGTAQTMALPRAQAAEGAARAVALGTGALSDPAGGAGGWNGSHVYFGNLGNYPISFRVLAKDTAEFGAHSMLLDADYCLARKAYSNTGNADWTASDLKTYLNTEFLMGNFSEAERNALLTSVKPGEAPLSGEKVFVLDRSEAANAAYGYGGAGALAKESMRLGADTVQYVLRSPAGGAVYTVDGSGSIAEGVASETYYFSPAVNLNTDRILFTYPAEQDKPAYLAPVGAADDNYFKLTMLGGAGFDAARKDNEANTVPAGYGFLVDVRDVGAAEEGVNYNRISGMLVDGTGSVAAYGALSEIAATGEVLVNIPAVTPAGDYKLYVFAEDVRSAYYDHATDYASNFATINVKVGDAAAVSESAQKVVEYQNAQKTEQAQQKQAAQKQSGQQAAQQAQPKQAAQQAVPKATAHKINLTTDGNGQVQSSVKEATVGTVVLLSNTPNKDYHFLRWESGDVSVASDNKFTMPDKDITVKAVFEKNVSTHTIRLGYMENSTVSLSATNAAKGTKVKAECKPKSGYHFVKWHSEGLTNDLKSDNPIEFTMPDNDVLIQAVCEVDAKKEYTITMKTSGQGSAFATRSKAAANVWVDLGAIPADGWRFSYWDSNQVNPGGQGRFLMPARNVTVTAVFERIPESTYSVSTASWGEGGSIWTTNSNGSPKTSFNRGEKVYVQEVVESGYYTSSLRADGVDLNMDSRGTTYFYMPERDVTVTAVFERDQPKEYRVDVVSSGDGSGWCQDAGWNSRSSFAEGETVYLQTVHNNSDIDSITSSDVKINTVSDGSYDASFTMPARNVTIYLRFKAPAPKPEAQYSVSLSLQGPGSIYTRGGDGAPKTSFKAGESVYVAISGEGIKVDSMYTNVETDLQFDGKGNLVFTMPESNVTLTLITSKEAEPAQEVNPATPSLVDDEGGVDSWYPDQEDSFWNEVDFSSSDGSMETESGEGGF